jgi:Phospholipid-translocating ATPase N-terminal
MHCSRYIPWNLQEHKVSSKFEGNSVSTAKYDPYFVTFVPLFLFEMFSRVAYLYFLIQVRHHNGAGRGAHDMQQQRCDDA